MRGARWDVAMALAGLLAVPWLALTALAGGARTAGIDYEENPYPEINPCASGLSEVTGTIKVCALISETAQIRVYTEPLRAMVWIQISETGPTAHVRDTANGVAYVQDTEGIGLTNRDDWYVSIQTWNLAPGVRLDSEMVFLGVSPGQARTFVFACDAPPCNRPAATPTLTMTSRPPNATRTPSATADVGGTATLGSTETTTATATTGPTGTNGPPTAAATPTDTDATPEATPAPSMAATASVTTTHAATATDPVSITSTVTVTASVTATPTGTPTGPIDVTPGHTTTADPGPSTETPEGPTPGTPARPPETPAGPSPGPSPSATRAPTDLATPTPDATPLPTASWPWPGTTTSTPDPSFRPYAVFVPFASR